MDNPTRQKLEGGTSQAAGEQGDMWDSLALPGISTGAAEAGLHAMENGQRCGIPWDECPQHICGCRWLETGEP